LLGFSRCCAVYFSEPGPSKLISATFRRIAQFSAKNCRVVEDDRERTVTLSPSCARGMLKRAMSSNLFQRLTNDSHVGAGATSRDQKEPQSTAIMSTSRQEGVAYRQLRKEFLLPRWGPGYATPATFKNTKVLPLSGTVSAGKCVPEG